MPDLNKRIVAPTDNKKNRKTFFEIATMFGSQNAINNFDGLAGIDNGCDATKKTDKNPICGKVTRQILKFFGGTRSNLA